MPSFVVDHDSPLAVWGQVLRDLRRRLEAGEFPPGSWLATETEMMAHYRVGRVTVRRAVGELVREGYVVTRRGSGSVVRRRRDVPVELDLTRPWRDQIVSAGRDARSILVPTPSGLAVPPEMIALIGPPPLDRAVTSGRHLQSVDGIPIAVTESWFVERAADDLARHGSDREPIVEHGRIEAGLATAEQAALLRTHLDAPLLVVVTRSGLESTGAAVEMSRTSWVGSRVRLLHARTLLLGQIDMAQLREGGSRL